MQHFLEPTMDALPAQARIDRNGAHLHRVSRIASCVDYPGDILRRAHRRPEDDIDLPISGSRQKLFRP
jgi:hypothetical protein